MTGFAIVSTTVASEAKAVALGRALVEAKLAACVQMAPVTSVYRWEGKIETTQEHLLSCKIAAARFGEVAEAIAAHHDYAVPEIIMLPIEAASLSYAAWLKAETAASITCLGATRTAGGTHNEKRRCPMWTPPPSQAAKATSAEKLRIRRRCQPSRSS